MPGCEHSSNWQVSVHTSPSRAQRRVATASRRWRRAPSRSPALRCSETNGVPRGASTCWSPPFQREHRAAVARDRRSAGCATDRAGVGGRRGGVRGRVAEGRRRAARRRRRRRLARRAALLSARGRSAIQRVALLAAEQREASLVVAVVVLLGRRRVADVAVGQAGDRDAVERAAGCARAGRRGCAGPSAW